ncbi:MAG: hypothetical protein SPG93_07230, partial [Prevotella sp.]|nr:hypothetical protein [Prevotella sp.]
LKCTGFVGCDDIFWYTILDILLNGCLAQAKVSLWQKFLAEGWLPGHSEGGDRPSASMLTKTHKILAVMQVDSRGGVYIFSRSRGDNRATELLPQRSRTRRRALYPGIVRQDERRPKMDGYDD